jgi:hypothetical protein
MGRSAAKKLARQRLNAKAAEEREELHFFDARALALQSRAIAKRVHRCSNKKNSSGSLSSGHLHTTGLPPSSSGSLCQIVRVPPSAPMGIARLSDSSGTPQATRGDPEADVANATADIGGNPSDKLPAFVEGPALDGRQPAKSEGSPKATAVAATVNVHQVTVEASAMRTAQSQGEII